MVPTPKENMKFPNFSRIMSRDISFRTASDETRMGLSTVHTSAKTADPTEVIAINKRRVKHSQCLAYCRFSCMGQSAGRLPRKMHAGSMPFINGVSICFSSSSGITSSPVMKSDARPTTLYSRKLSRPYPFQAYRPNNVDTKQILTSSPFVYWKRPPG